MSSSKLLHGLAENAQKSMRFPKDLDQAAGGFGGSVRPSVTLYSMSLLRLVLFCMSNTIRGYKAPEDIFFWMGMEVCVFFLGKPGNQYIPY